MLEKFLRGGKCPGGICPRGVIVRGYLSGGNCPGGNCPGGNCPDTVSVLGQLPILQNTSKYKGSAWLWQTLVIWWLLKKPFWGGIKPKT